MPLLWPPVWPSQRSNRQTECLHPSTQAWLIDEILLQTVVCCPMPGHRAADPWKQQSLNASEPGEGCWLRQWAAASQTENESLMRLSGQAASFPMGHSFFSSVCACMRAWVCVCVCTPLCNSLISSAHVLRQHRCLCSVSSMTPKGTVWACTCVTWVGRNVKVAFRSIVQNWSLRHTWENMGQRQQKYIRPPNPNNNRFTSNCLTKRHNETNDSWVCTHNCTQ